MIADLSQELFEKVLSYCCIDDLANISYCCKSLNTRSKHLLWRSVRIDQELLQRHHLPKYTKNIMYTTSLLLDGDIDSEPDVRRETTWGKVGFNFSRVLNYCNPHILSKLTICGLSTDAGVQYAIEVLYNIEQLSLAYIPMISWESLNGLPKLKKLSLYCCTINEGSGVLTTNSLDELLMLFPKETTGGIMCAISNLVNLTKLSMNCKGHFSEDRLKLIGNFTNLVHLDIPCMKINDNVLIHLCRTLTRLEVLHVGNDLTDHGFSEIHLLNLLTELDFGVGVSNSLNASQNCFRYISRLPLLRRLAFSSTICDSGTDVMSYLNQCRSLEKIMICSRDGHNPFTIYKIMRELCAEKEWKVTLNDYVCTLTQ